MQILHFLPSNSRHWQTLSNILRDFMHQGETQKLKLRKSCRCPLSEVSPLKYRRVTKSEDARTREVTAAAKCDEESETISLCED